MVDDPEEIFESFAWNIPAANHEGNTLAINIDCDDRIFIVGANGSGKSALVQHLVGALGNRPMRRISAHRQTWLQSGAVDITPQARLGLDTGIRNLERRDDARWMDHNTPQRLSAVLFDLIANENRRARKIVDLMDGNNSDEANNKYKETVSPLKLLNTLLRIGNLTVHITLSDEEELLAHHVDGETFSIAKLSDGERNAVILAANILTVKPGIMLLIDEPERHLHRSIIEPFLSALFDCRSDCPFIVSTHELSLPVFAPKSRVLLPRSCQWEGERPKDWNIDLLADGIDLPDDLKTAVLGSRERILFVEGKVKSLDAPMYLLLFSNITVLPKGSCNEVMRAVEGLRGVENLQWVEAFGLVDRDDRTVGDIADLQGRNIYALEVHSAKAIYYSASALQRMATRQAQTLGVEADKLLAKVTEIAIWELADDETMNRMCARRSERLVRERVLPAIPNWQTIQEGADITVSVSVKDILDDEIARYQHMLNENDVNGLISRYPIRETAALEKVAKALEFTGRSKYEQAVLALASAEDEFRSELRALLEPLYETLN